MGDAKGKYKTTPDKFSVCIDFSREEDRERFNQMRRTSKKKNQAELVLMLMDMYDKQDCSVEPTLFSIPMYIRVSGIPSKTSKITFEGEQKYSSNWSYPVQLDTVTANKLEREFNYGFFDGEPYLYSHRIDLYYLFKEKRYLIHEMISVEVRSDWFREVEEGNISAEPLDVSRCQIVRDFDEAYTYFSRYTTVEEFFGISEFLAQDIGNDYSRLNEFFILNLD